MSLTGLREMVVVARRNVGDDRVMEGFRLAFEER